MTSGCLDRKEVRGAIWRVHSTTDRPAGGNTGRLFLAFGGPVCANRISNCPLDRVLTYKNLIYLLNLQFFKDNYKLILYKMNLYCFWSIMASPGQKRRTCGHTMALSDSHAHVAVRKALGKTPVLRRSNARFVTVFLKIRKDNWPHLHTGHVRSSRRKQALPPLPPPTPVDPADVTVLGQVESSKGKSSDQGETPSNKKKSSHNSPSKKSSKAGKTAGVQADLKNLDEKWSEHFAQLEAMFLAKYWLNQSRSTMWWCLTDPFIPPVQQTTGVTGQKASCSTTGQQERKKATQPAEAPGAVLATRPVEAPRAAVDLTGQDASPFAAADRSEVEPPGPASSTSTSGQPEVQPPGPTAQAAFDTMKHAASPVLVTKLMSHLQILSSLVTMLLQVLLIRKAVNSCVVNHTLSATGLPQKKGVIPNYCYLCPEIKHVKDVSCVDQSSFVKTSQMSQLLYQIYL